MKTTLLAFTFLLLSSSTVMAQTAIVPGHENQLASPTTIQLNQKLEFGWIRRKTFCDGKEHFVGLGSGCCSITLFKTQNDGSNYTIEPDKYEISHGVVNQRQSYSLILPKQGSDRIQLTCDNSFGNGSAATEATLKHAFGKTITIVHATTVQQAQSRNHSIQSATRKSGAGRD